MNMTDKSLFMQNESTFALRRKHTSYADNIIAAAGDLLRRGAANLARVSSFYGMRALLILYLTNQLKYDDNHAYALFSAYCSLVYVTPILGGYLADKLLGNRMAVMLGALLMAIGHLVLGPAKPLRFSCTCRWRSSSAATGCLNPTSAVCWGSCTNPPIRVAMAAFR